MSVVACPKCSEEVSVPPRAPKEAIVRCPLCCETYTLSDAFAKLPPMLEVIEVPSLAGGFDDEPYADERATRKPRYATAGAPSAAYSQAAFAGELAEEDEDQSELSFAGGSPLDSLSDAAETATETEPGSEEQVRMPLGRTPVKREPLHPPGSRKKRNQGSAIGSLVAIVLGGAMAIPSALLLLLWLPGDLAKDPFKLSPWLAENAPYLLPEQMKAKLNAATKKPTAGSNPKIDTSSGGKQIADNNKKPAAKSVDDKPGLDFGNKFDNALGGEKTEPEMKPDETTPKPELPELPGVPEPKSEPAVVDNAELTKALDSFVTIDGEFDTVMAGSDKDAKKTVGNAWYQSLANLSGNVAGDAAVVDDTFTKLAASASKIRVIGLLALNAMKAENRTQDGIALAGTVKACRKGADDLCEITIEVAPGKPNIIVIGSEIAEGTKVLIAGKITDEPAKVLADYASSEPRAVQARLIKEVK